MEPGHEDREYSPCSISVACARGASMEPGHEDREYILVYEEKDAITSPQWSPVMKTGNTFHWLGCRTWQQSPQWSPVMKTGNTRPETADPRRPEVPQWSPVMKTGNTYTAA